MKPPIIFEPLLVGRDHELDQLHKWLDSTFEGNGKTVFISGEAGSGKTRLINEFLSQARKKDINLITGWCLSNAAIPYFPFIEALSGFSQSMNNLFAYDPFQVEGRGNSVNTQISSFENSQTFAPQVRMDQIFASVSRELLYLSAKKPTILVLEDIHWADSASLALLHYISRAIRSESVFVLASFRSEELNSDLDGQPLPLVESLRLMGRESLYEKIDLPRLNAAQISKMASSILGGNLDQNFIEKLANESQGNPLFIVESLTMLVNDGSLTKGDGKWCLSIDKFGTPLKIKDLILQRLSALKTKHRRILDVASVIGDKFDSILIGAVMGQDSLQILEKLTLIAQSTSLVCCEGNYYRFDHAKTREVIYDVIPTPLKIGYHAKIGERLEKVNKSILEFRVSDLAYHYQKAGNDEKSLKYALAAGKDALCKFSNAEAIKHFTYVLENAATIEDFTLDKTSAIEGIGDALFAEGRFEESERIFQSLCDSDSGIIRLRALRKWMHASFLRGNIAYSVELLDKAKEYAYFDRIEYARVRLSVGWALGFRGKIKEGISHIEESLAIFEEANSISDIAEALYNLAELYITENRIEDAIAAVQRSLFFYKEIEDIRGEMEAHFRAGHVFFNCKLLCEASESYSKTVEIGRRIGDYNRMAWATSYLSWVSESKGDLKEALSINQRAVEYSEKTDSFYAQSISYASFVRLYSKLGDVVSAEKYYEKLMITRSDISTSASKLSQVVIVRSEADICAARGEWKRACDFFGESLKLLRGSLFESLTEAEIRADYAWALKKRGFFSEAEDQVKKIETLTAKLENMFERANIKAFLIARRRQGSADEVDIRLDLLNLGKGIGTLLRINDLVPSQFLLLKLPVSFSFEEGVLNLKGKKITSFSELCIKFTLKVVKEEAFSFKPLIFFMDDFGKVMSVKPEIRNLIPQEIAKEKDESLCSSALFDSARNKETTCEFELPSAQKAFDYLVCAFIEDYVRNRFSIEQSGWRTLAEISKYGEIPLHSVYGRNTRFGVAISELERRGLVEKRFYSGERGRGGKILRIRVYYDKEMVKKVLESRLKKTTKINSNIAEI